MIIQTSPSRKKSEEKSSSIKTPYYLIDEEKLLSNLKKIARVRELSGAKSVLALKCFSTWSVFDIMKPYMDGTTSSSLYETRLGFEKFGKETHAYSVAFSEEDVLEAKSYATKFIFNSVSQLNRFRPLIGKIPVGLRINPGVSVSDFDLADPARCHSRLGVTNKQDVISALSSISGAMFHCQCENDSLEKFSGILDHIANNYGDILQKLDWVSLGGGIYFTKDGYPLDAFAEKLKKFAEKFQVQVYLEPGESTITGCGSLVTSVLDIVHNDKDIAIIDAAVETHMLDLLIYSTPAKVSGVSDQGHEYIIAGRTCLAGDIFGTYKFPHKLNVGDHITITDAAGYTMVKKNWFNGIQMPSIAIKRADGRVELAKTYSYADYSTYLS